MKKIFDAPTIKVTRFDVEDIVTTSGNDAVTNAKSGITQKFQSLSGNAGKTLSIAEFNWTTE